MGDCGCGKKVGPTGPASGLPVVPAKKIAGIVTKKTCPKCSYWMSLVIVPSSKEKTFKCQNTMCKHSMPYSPS